MLFVSVKRLYRVITTDTKHNLPFENNEEISGGLRVSLCGRVRLSRMFIVKANTRCLLNVLLLGSAKHSLREDRCFLLCPVIFHAQQSRQLIKW